MRVIAAIDDAPLVEKILAHLNLPTARPEISPARSPPLLDFDGDVDDSDFATVDDFEMN